MHTREAKYFPDTVKTLLESIVNKGRLSFSFTFRRPIFAIRLLPERARSILWSRVVHTYN